MTQFERAIQQDEIKCDICGGAMLAMYGGGWDNDRIVCGGRECGGVIEYPTSTLAEESQPTPAEAGQAVVDAMTVPAGTGCTWCGSRAINQHLHGRTVGKMPNLCDVCYWRATAADIVKGGK